jgi:hypothetical protein
LLKEKDHIRSRIFEPYPDSPAAISDINHALGQRYTPDGIFECPIDKGTFECFIDKGCPRTYERQETKDMPYFPVPMFEILRVQVRVS